MPEDIELLLKTTGDTTGAEEVEKSLKKVNTEVKQVGETATKADPQLGQIVNLGRAAAAAQLAQGIGKIGETIRGLGADFKSTDAKLASTLENSATALDSVTGALSGAAQGFAVGGPFGAAVGGMIGLLSGPLKTAYAEMTEAIRGASKAEEAAAENVKKLADARRAYAQEQRNLAIRAIYDGETAAISKTVTEMEKLARLSAAQRSADAATAAAVNGPATPQQKITNDQSAALAEVQANVDEAQALATESAKLATAAAANAERVIKSQGETSEAATKAVADRDAAVQRADTEQARADEIAQSSQIKEQQILAAALTAENALAEQAGDSITSIGENALKGMQATAKEEGVKLDAAQKLGMQTLSKLLTDSIPDEKQYQPIKQAMELFRSGLNSFHQAQFDSMTKLLSELSTANANVVQIDVRRSAMIDALTQQQAETKQRLSDQEYRIKELSSRTAGAFDR